MSAPVIFNCIFWDDSANGGYGEIFATESSPSINYCNIAGNWPGEGNIDGNPAFRDPLNDDYHLAAIGCGDSLDSPCIDMGSPDLYDILLDCDWGLGMSRSDMGAYGGGDSLEADIDDISRVPDNSMLLQNYPNPFNAQTTISYLLPYQTAVTLQIYDILGRKVQTLVDGIQPGGNYDIIWDVSNASSGVYFAKLQTADIINTTELVLLK